MRQKFSRICRGMTVANTDGGNVGHWALEVRGGGRGEGGRCSSRKLASESFNTLPWITVSHSLTNPNHKRLCVQRSHDLTGSIAFSGCSPNVFLSRFDEISRRWYVTLWPNEWALDLCDWTALFAASTKVTVRGDSRLLKANESLLYAIAFSRWSN